MVEFWSREPHGARHVLAITQGLRFCALGSQLSLQKSLWTLRLLMMGNAWGEGGSNHILPSGPSHSNDASDAHTTTKAHHVGTCERTGCMLQLSQH